MTFCCQFITSILHSSILIEEKINVVFTSFPFSCLQIVLKYVIAPSPRRLHFRFASTAVAEDCQKFQKTYHETQDTCKCLTQPLLTVTFPMQAHSQCPSHLQTLRFSLASLGAFFLRQKLCLVFITGNLITSKAFHHTQTNLKWSATRSWQALKYSKTSFWKVYRKGQNVKIMRYKRLAGQWMLYNYTSITMDLSSYTRTQEQKH